MLDVVPPPDAGGFDYPSKKRARRTRPSSNVLKIDWKLPARLRKPIRTQLAAQRQQKRARLLGGFHRRPLTTQRVTAEVNTVRERHTADIYRDSEPSLRMVAPPYVGSVMKGALHGERSAIAPTPALSGGSTGGRGRKFVAPYEGEVLEQSEGRGVVEQPRSRLRLPFSVSILPRGLFKGRTEEATPPRSAVSKKKVFPLDRNVAILLVGCLLAVGVVWNLQGAGRGWKVLSHIQHQAEQALSRAHLAESALADADFAQSETAFADAERLLTGARRELDDALSTSRHALELLDVTGTIQSGDSMLTAGEALTVAGQHVSRGLASLLSAQVLPGETQSEGSTLIHVVETARSEFMQAEEALASAEEELSQVKSPLLPQEVSADVERLATLVPNVRNLLRQFGDQADMLLTLLGAQRDREYLLLFANNHELRPVGGFIGSVGLIQVDRGVVEEIDIKTVYDGDGQLKDFIAPPDPLSAIVDRWYLRDSNWFADYQVSAAKAAQFFEKEGGPTVDGVLLLTPDVIRELVRLAGPISVPGYDTTITADNFTEVIQREVTYEYDRTLNQPKQFLADLTPILLNRLFQAEQGQALGVLSALTQSLARKEMVLYFRDEELQKRIAELGWAGNLPKAAPGFLMVNNANIGGHKSDQFVDQEIDYRLEVASDGVSEAVVTVRRTHRGPTEGGKYSYPSGEDPAVKDNIVYQRVLVPEGSTLLSASGFTRDSEVPRLVTPQSGVTLAADADVAEWQRGQVKLANGTAVGREAGYTFFANWMVTKPGQTTVGLYRYRLPDALDMPGMLDEVSRVSAYVAKQPGAARTTTRVAIRLPEKMRIATTAPESGVTPVNDYELAYRAELTRDVVVGAVFSSR